MNGLPDSVEPPVNPNHEEYQYLNLIRDILDNGEHRPDRYIPPQLTLKSTNNLTDIPGLARAPYLCSPLGA